MRFSAQHRYSALISTPHQRLDNFSATTAVVPLPRNGSNTKPPFLELASISFAISFSGFWAGWSVFSGIDQNGIVKSVQMFDG